MKSVVALPASLLIHENYASAARRSNIFSHAYDLKKVCNINKYMYLKLQTQTSADGEIRLQQGFKNASTRPNYFFS